MQHTSRDDVWPKLGDLGFRTLNTDVHSLESPLANVLAGNPRTKWRFSMVFMGRSLNQLIQKLQIDWSVEN